MRVFMKMIKIFEKQFIIPFIILLSSCAQPTLEQYESADSLIKYQSVEEAVAYLKARERALEKLKDYAPKRRTGDGLSKLSDNADPAIEEILVSGIRASMGVDMYESDSVEALMRVDGVSITNNQEASVDEGGIVKRKGDYLIVLRRGRLYSIHIGSQLNKADEIDLQPETWKHDAWYDELLIHGNAVLVIGYSYENESTEYVFFKLDELGKFSRKSAYLVGSLDYYSEDNYAGRIVGNNFVFYLNNLEQLLEEDDIPGFDLKKLSPIAAKVDDFGKPAIPYPLFSQHDIYTPVLTSRYIQLSTVVVCPLNIDEFQCTAKSVMGAELKEYYASPDAFYFWMRGSEWNREYAQVPDDELRRFARSKYYERYPSYRYSVIVRVPFGSGTPGLVKIKGLPINQFSFKQNGEFLHLLARDNSEGERWFGAEYDPGITLATSIPVEEFNRGVSDWDESKYLTLEQKSSSGHKINRFVGDTLVYSSANEDTYTSEVYVFDLTHSNSPINLTTAMEVEQLHPIGKNMLLVGYDPEDSIQYQTLSLHDDVHIVDTYTEQNSQLAESRSHGFFYKPGGDGGIFGIPVFNESGEVKKDSKGYNIYAEDFTDMRYTRVSGELILQPAGVLEGDRTVIWLNDEDCEISCYDWYGSSRPIFWGDRIFALLKYQLVEGVLQGGIIQELQRIDIRGD